MPRWSKGTPAFHQLSKDGPRTEHLGWRRVHVDEMARGSVITGPRCRSSRSRPRAHPVTLPRAAICVLSAASGLVFAAAALGAPGLPGTRTNPHPLGHTAAIEKFAVTVVAVNPNAWARLQKISPHERPVYGTTYVLVTLRAKNDGRT